GTPRRHRGVDRHPPSVGFSAGQAPRAGAAIAGGAPPDGGEAMGTAQKAAHPAFAALPVGKRVAVSKTVGETDVYLFAGLSGDFAPLHVDEDYMRGTPYGRRIAHGALMIAYMSRASTAIAAACPASARSRPTATTGPASPRRSSSPTRSP